MPQKVEDIKDSILSNPDFQPREGRSRAESAWAIAWDRYKQMQKNNYVLSLKPKETEKKEKDKDPKPAEKALPFPPRPGLKWDGLSHRWKTEGGTMAEEQEATEKTSTPRNSWNESVQKLKKANSAVDAFLSTTFPRMADKTPKNPKGIQKYGNFAQNTNDTPEQQAIGVASKLPKHAVKNMTIEQRKAAENAISKMIDTLR